MEGRRGDEAKARWVGGKGGKQCQRGRAGRVDQELTLSDAGDGQVLVAVGLAQGKEDVDVGPVGEHLLDDGNLAAVELVELADLALVVEGGQGRVGIVLGVAVERRASGGIRGAGAAPGRETTAAAATRAAAARGGWSGLYLRHGWLRV